MLNSKNMINEAGMADHEMEIDSDLEEDAWQVRNEADMTMPGSKK